MRDESMPEPDNSPPPMGPTIIASISIRALVPDWDAAAVAVAMRMVDRLQVYEQYVTYWRARPQVSISHYLIVCASDLHTWQFPRPLVHVICSSSLLQSTASPAWQAASFVLISTCKTVIVAAGAPPGSASLS